MSWYQWVDTQKGVSGVDSGNAKFPSRKKNNSVLIIVFIIVIMELGSLKEYTNA